ncbi:MAG: hypothetical protein HC842_08185 [Cytophagales bacterium]|nr:hypothetical protein [Cytophagales bacterium]
MTEGSCIRTYDPRAKMQRGTPLKLGAAAHKKDQEGGGQCQAQTPTVAINQTKGAKDQIKQRNFVSRVFHRVGSKGKVRRKDKENMESKFYQAYLRG